MSRETIPPQGLVVTTVEDVHIVTEAILTEVAVGAAQATDGEDFCETICLHTCYGLESVAAVLFELQDQGAVMATTDGTKAHFTLSEDGWRLLEHYDTTWFED